MLGWKITDILSFGAAAGFLIFLAVATRPTASILNRSKRALSEKTIRRIHIIVLATLIIGFVCMGASAVCYIMWGE